MTTMNNEDPADPSVHEQRELPASAAWVQPDHLQKARLAPFMCRVELVLALWWRKKSFADHLTLPETLL